jgi:hypothetical protein
VLALNFGAHTMNSAVAEMRDAAQAFGDLLQKFVAA